MSGCGPKTGSEEWVVNAGVEGWPGLDILPAVKGELLSDAGGPELVNGLETLLL